MQPRLTISCQDHVAFVVTHGRPGHNALHHPLWLRHPANENQRIAGKTRLRVIENSIVRGHV
jgi:hypothetical protein